MKKTYNPATPRVARGPAAALSPRRWLERQELVPSPSPTKPEPAFQQNPQVTHLHIKASSETLV